LGHGEPGIVVDEPQLRHLLDDPFALGVDARDAAAAGRVLDEVLPVPDEAADVKLVSENAAAPPAVAGDDAALPRPPAGPRHSHQVQGTGDCCRRAAGGELAEDAAHHVGLDGVDAAAPADRLAADIEFADKVVAVGAPTGGPALPDPALQPAVGLQ